MARLIQSGLQTAFARVLRAKTVPPMKDWLALSQELDRFNLIEWLNTALPESAPSSARHVVRVIVDAATSQRPDINDHSRGISLSEAERRRDEIGQSGRWLKARGELSKLVRQIPTEIDLQNPDAALRSLAERVGPAGRRRIAKTKARERSKPLTPQGANPLHEKQDGPPNWIREHFVQQQYKLLSRLWGREEVPADELARHLGYTKPTTALDNLRRRVAETNNGLAEKARMIGSNWAIGQRKRDDRLFYFLLHSGSSAV